MIDLQDVSVGNPFPGLRPFETDEYHLFFGREGQSDELIKRLRVTRFLAVVGTSGSGKSSLIRAGLLPALHGGLMPGAGSSWRVALTRPGHDPIGNLAHELGAILDDGHTDPEIQNTLIETTLRRSTLGLVDAVRQARVSPHEKLLVVVDQFEELFRFKEARKETDSEDDALGFVKLLIEASAQVEVPIYVVLTMRSDFLGDCSQFAGLPEAINQGQYLIPRMSRDERRAAITGPVAVGGGEMTVPLINRLLNDVGDNPDQLPILQHALMRTWDYSVAHRRNGEAIGLEHYEAIGSMSEALSRHADEAFNELPNERSRLVAEKIFKALTEQGAANRETRRPVPLHQLCTIADATETEVVDVIETFRSEGRSFLMPPAGTPLEPDTIIDISHESLIRNWERLHEWVNEEARSAQIYRRLAEAAVLYHRKEEGLLSGPFLQIALDWREKQAPNRVWAYRYNPEFETANRFLDASRDDRDAKLAAQEREREAQLASERRELEMTRDFAEKQARSARRLRWLAIGMAVMFLLALATAGYAMTQRKQAQANERIAADREKEAVRQKAALADALAVKERSEEARRHSEMSRDAAEHSRREAEMQRKQALDRALSEAKRANEQARVAAAKQVEAEKLRDEALASREANSLYRSAYSSWNNDNLTRARDNFRNAAKQFQGLKDYSAVGASLFALAEIDIKDTAAKQRDEAAAFDSYDEAARYYQQSNDRDGVASVLAAKGAYLTKYPSEAPLRPSPKVPREDLREEEGVKFLEQALAGYEATGNWEAAISVVELIRPLFWFKPDEKQRVIADAEKLLTLFTKAKDADGQKKVMLELSSRYERDGNHARANEYREAAVKVYRDVGDHRKEAGTLVEIAVGEPSLEANEREAYLERALQVFQRVRDPEGEVEMLTHIGNQYLTRGDLGTRDNKVRLSAKYLEKALAIYESLGRRKEQAGLLTYMGSHARSIASSSRLKEHDELALEYYLRALAIYRALNDKANEKETLAFVAAGYSLVKRLPEAIDTNKQLLAFETEPAKQVDRLREIAFMQRELKSPEAIDTFRRMLAIYQATDQKLMQAYTLVSIGTTQVLMSRPAEAVDSFNQALVLHAGATDKNGRAGALYGLGTALEALGKLPQALETFKQALALFRETKNDDRSAEAEKRIEAITKLLQPK